MQKGCGFARTGMPFKQTNKLPRVGKAHLRLCPRQRRIFGAAQIFHRDRQIIGVERLRCQRRMIVVMANVAQEERTIGGSRKIVRFFERGRVLRRPPGIELTTLSASEPRTPPASIDALRGFVVKALYVDSQPLHQKGNAFSDTVVVMVRELFKKLLMTEYGVSRP